MSAPSLQREELVAQLLAECVGRGLTVSELNGAAGVEYRAPVESAVGVDAAPEGVWRAVFPRLLEAMARAVRGSTGRQRVPRCSSCGQPIRWVTTEAGKRLALDPLPHRMGNVTRAPGTRRDVATVHPTCDLPIPGGAAYRPHWATCPHANEHRGKITRLVPKCRVCKQALHAGLVELGYTTHPHCDPEEVGP